MKQSGPLPIIAFICLSVLAIDGQTITVTKSSIDKNEVLVKANLQGKPTEFWCYPGVPTCSEPTPGEYTMVRAAADEWIYSDCTNVALYKSSGAAREKVGVYCWPGSGDCYISACPQIETFPVTTRQPLSLPPIQATGTIVIYRERGKNFGLIHYAEGEHPTIYCDGIKVAKMRESHIAEVSASVGQHTCVALEKQYPGELNVDSGKASVDIKPNSTTYIRLQCPFGHLHFVLREVPEETGSAEAAKMQPSKKGDFYTAVLPAVEEKKSPAPQ